MADVTLLYPMAALVLLTFIVIIRMGILRVRAMRDRTVTLKQARVTATAPFPDSAKAAAAHMQNLFQTPVLFYTVCLTAMQLGAVDGAMVYLAWAYVAARSAHAWIHVTYNNVLHRFYAFLTSLALLAAMWVVLVVAVVANN